MHRFFDGKKSSWRKENRRRKVPGFGNLSVVRGEFFPKNINDVTSVERINGQRSFEFKILVCILSSFECSFRIRSNISRIDRTSGRFAKNAFLRFVVKKLNFLTVIDVNFSSFYLRSFVFFYFALIYIESSVRKIGP